MEKHLPSACSSFLGLSHFYFLSSPALPLLSKPTQGELSSRRLELNYAMYLSHSSNQLERMPGRAPWLGVGSTTPHSTPTRGLIIPVSFACHYPDAICKPGWWSSGSYFDLEEQVQHCTDLIIWLSMSSHADGWAVSVPHRITGFGGTAWWGKAIRENYDAISHAGMCAKHKTHVLYGCKHTGWVMPTSHRFFSESVQHPLLWYNW